MIGLPLNLGKLYQVIENYWMLYPTKQDALNAEGDMDKEAFAISYADYWSTQRKCNVSYISPETMFFPIEVAEPEADQHTRVKIVSTEGIGWIVLYPQAGWGLSLIHI